ncbi:endonuclease/exonuclease/phosphatase family protein [Aridibaculum aurantiacum]|uniref:endonuclease/exonuclease/phosphatase family protein n=1 Tax=Aridibaculum aurantiacum TaxID=2810307 RepID=UPI001A968D64|nr:endonuclease/exonuclease/phosphatase family protein [Aridibaculum aurantiacum]
MRRLFLPAIFFVIAISGFSQDHLNVMSFNIRLTLPQDSLNNWPYRKDKVTSQILFHDAHILGVQEALPGQMTDLQQGLKTYKPVGESREGGYSKGELSAIFVDTTRLKVLDSATFWLSENPTVIGVKGWDAALPRVVTWVKLRDKKTRKTFYFFNTHFDHIGKVARRESARLLRSKVSEIAGNSPVIITGDFNATPVDEPIQLLTDMAHPDRFTDARHISQTPHYGPTWTFNGFRKAPTSGNLLDYIFVRNNVSVLKHAYLSQTWDSRFASDHFAVFARVAIK